MKRMIWLSTLSRSAFAPQLSFAADLCVSVSLGQPGCYGQIDIGNAAAGMATKMNEGMPQANGTFEPEPTMDVGDVARSVDFMAQLPLDSNVQFITVIAHKGPCIGRGTPCAGPCAGKT